ncbi:major facilitator superfamily domain-containing protein [Xylogone sp. PMI_703]|nr:major facilitator superfamily domain-containing protein [Xylogone sp. PMI_703]
MAQASTGYNQSMDVMGWIIFWRFWIGMGIGAEYPLSAVITAEFAGVKSRPRMMASVFLMQPLGQLLVAVVGWATLVGIGRSRGIDNLPANGDLLNDQQKFEVLSTIDTIWRCIVGVGAFPALVAIIYRLSIPESPRYTLDIIWDAEQALADVRKYQGQNEKPISKDLSNEPMLVQQNGNMNGSHLPIQLPSHPTPPQDISRPIAQPEGAVQLATLTPKVAPNYFTRKEIYDFFWTGKNIRYLAATSICWFLLDIAFYGLGIGNPRQLAAIWASSNHTEVSGWPYTHRQSPYATFSNSTFPDWENPFNPNTNMYHELFDNAFKYTITVSIGSILGSVVLILVINRLKRKLLLVRTFIILFILFAVTGATLKAVEFQTAHALTIAFYILCQFFFNFGPNTLTYMIPAEIFPTKYRCTCHGISAAFGKAGSIIVQLILSSPRFGHHPTDLGFVLGIFAVLMALGALIAWVWLPELQEKPTGEVKAESFPFLKSKNLEALGEGYSMAIKEDPPQILGFRNSFKELYKRIKKRWTGRRAKSRTMTQDLSAVDAPPEQIDVIYENVEATTGAQSLEK